MRISLVFVLLIVVSFLLVLSETDVSPSEPFVKHSSVNTVAPNENEQAFVPVVDRGDDPSSAEMANLQCTAAANDCPLRQALALTTASGKGQAITFADHYIITLTRPLPPMEQEGTTLVARAGQEVRLNGNGQPGPVVHLTGSRTRLEGLTIYGAGPGYPNVLLNGNPREVVIARNVIGDDDAAAGNCGQNQQAAYGIYVQTSDEPLDGTRAWIYGNIIECHQAAAGTGLVIKSSGVRVGVDKDGQTGAGQRNTIRLNEGVAVRLDDFGGNTIRNNRIHDNQGGTIAVTNFNNDIVANEIG